MSHHFVEAFVADSKGNPLRKDASGESSKARVWENANKTMMMFRKKYNIENKMIVKVTYKNKQNRIVEVRAGDKFILSDVQGKDLRIYLEPWPKGGLKAAGEKPSALQQAPRQPQVGENRAGADVGFIARIGGMLGRSFAQAVVDTNVAPQSNKTAMRFNVAPTHEAARVANKAGLSRSGSKLFDELCGSIPSDGVNGLSSEDVLATLIVHHQRDKNKIAIDINKWEEGELDLQWLSPAVAHAGRQQPKVASAAVATVAASRSAAAVTVAAPSAAASAAAAVAPSPVRPAVSPSGVTLQPAHNSLEALASKLKNGNGTLADAEQFQMIVKNFDHPNIRQFALHLIKGYTRVYASPQGKNLCWENWFYQAIFGKTLSSPQLDHLRKHLRKPFFALLSTFDDESRFNLFFDRAADGRQTGSPMFNKELLAKVIRERTQPGAPDNTPGGIVELSVLAMLFGVRVKLHMDPTASWTTADAVDAERSCGLSTSEHIITLTPPRPFLQADTIADVHAFYYNVEGFQHYDNLFLPGVAPVFSETVDCDALYKTAQSKIEGVAKASQSITRVPSSSSLLLDEYRRPVFLPETFSSPPRPTGSALVEERLRGLTEMLAKQQETIDRQQRTIESLSLLQQPGRSSLSGAWLPELAALSHCAPLPALQPVMSTAHASGPAQQTVVSPSTANVPLAPAQQKATSPLTGRAPLPAQQPVVSPSMANVPLAPAQQKATSAPTGRAPLPAQQTAVSPSTANVPLAPDPQKATSAPTGRAPLPAQQTAVSPSTANVPLAPVPQKATSPLTGRAPLPAQQTVVALFTRSSTSGQPAAPSSDPNLLPLPAPHVTQPQTELPQTVESFLQHLGGSNPSIDDKNVEQMMAFAKNLALTDGDMFQNVFKVPKISENGRQICFYESEFFEQAWNAVSDFVLQTLRNLAGTPKAGGAQTKAAGDFIKCAARDVSRRDNTKQQCYAVSLALQRLRLRSFEQLLQFAAPNFKLQKGLIREFYDTDADATQIMDVSPCAEVVDLSSQ
jgi:hypothetical protein